MAARRAISKSLRYEIFTRDSYTCQYCGSKPPDTVLELDHRVPVAKGGGNDSMNLLTACQSCNSGKSAKMPMSYAPIPDADLQSLKLAQELAEYRRFLEAERLRDEALGEVIDCLHQLWVEADISIGGHLPSSAVVKGWILRFGPDIAAEAIRKSTSAFAARTINCFGNSSTDRACRYVSGIMLNLQKEREYPA